MLYIWQSDDSPEMKSALLLPLCCDMILDDNIRDPVRE